MVSSEHSNSLVGGVNVNGRSLLKTTVGGNIYLVGNKTLRIVTELHNMANKGIKLDDVLVMVQDERVTEQLVTSLSPIMENMFDKLAEIFILKLEGLVENMVEKFAGGKLSKSTERQNQQISTLKAENNELRKKLEEVETTIRLNNLIIYGLTESASTISDESAFTISNNDSKLHLLGLVVESSVSAVIDFCKNRLHLDIKDSDVSFACRIPFHGMNKCRPVVVGFTLKNTRYCACC